MATADWLLGALELRKKMDEVEVDNETVHWNCQDYVIEAIDHLREECIIDEDDEDYERGRKDAVENHYGPREPWIHQSTAFGKGCICHVLQTSPHILYL